MRTPGPDSERQPAASFLGVCADNRAEDPAGIVVAVCAGHRCSALTRASGNGGLGPSIARSSGGVLISASCLQQCARGAVAAVAVRTRDADLTGPSLWFGGIEAVHTMAALRHWIEHWRPTREQHQEQELPEELRGTLLGVGAPIRLTPTRL